MSLFSDWAAVSSLQKIRAGGQANLSLSQIVCLIINLGDARNNLSSEEYIEVKKLFDFYRDHKSRMLMNIETYTREAIRIIKEFDKIAPYEKYSGGDEREYSIMMEDIRNQEKRYNLFLAKKMMDKDEKEDNNFLDYVNYIIDESKGIISEEEAKEIMGILYCYKIAGKRRALDVFKDVANRLISEAPDGYRKIPSVIKILYSNDIVDDKERRELLDRYLKYVPR